jgi:hypothetical protein
MKALRYSVTFGCAALLALLAVAYLAGTRSAPVASRGIPAIAALRTPAVRTGRPIPNSDEIVGHPDDGIVALPERSTHPRPR